MTSLGLAYLYLKSVNPSKSSTCIMSLGSKTKSGTSMSFEASMLACETFLDNLGVLPPLVV